MERKKLIILIIVVLIILLLVLATIFLLRKRNVNTENNKETESEYVFGEDHTIYKVYDASEFFSVTSSINTYLNMIASQDKKAVYNLLDKAYINKFNITEENVLEKVTGVRELKIFQGKQMYYSDAYDSMTYFVYGTMKADVFEDEELAAEDLYITIDVDMTNWTFAITPNTIEGITKIEDLYNGYNINREKKEIEKNDNNGYNYVSVGNSALINTYLNDYKNNALHNVEKAYNSLDEEYRNKRFGNLEEYKKYVEENKNDITNIALNRYDTAEQEDSIEHTCTDMNDNYYMFKETAIMEYSLILDTYTLDLPVFTQNYNEADSQGKVALNIQKFVDSINVKDYKYAYSKLADGFESTNFSNLQSFETYVKNTLYNKNKVEYVIFDEEAGLYTYKIRLVNKESEEGTNVVEKTIIMSLGEGTDFTLSFNI
jgi:hypothetical protein